MQEGNVNLKELREEKGITLAEIHAESKIPLRLLKAIEEMNFSELPEPSFARNLIKSYGKHTGIDITPILAQYEQYLSYTRRPEKSPPEPTPPDLDTKKSFPLWLMGVIVLASVFSLVLFYLFTDRPPRLPPSPPEPATQTTALPEPALEKRSEMRLKISAHEPTWLKIKADDEPPTEVMLRSGEVIERTALNSLYLDIGNAGGVEVTFQGKSLGKLGERGEVVHLKFP